MPGVQPVTTASRAGIESRGLGYEPSWSSGLALEDWDFHLYTIIYISHIYNYIIILINCI